MAQFDVALQWMLDNEDSQRKYATVPDVGGEAISGVNSSDFPNAFAAINALPQNERAAAVAAFYQSQFWGPAYTALASDDVAKRVFDAAVNMGPGTAVKMLQTAINTRTKPPITVDGGFGPGTIAAANACNPTLLVEAFIEVRKAHYKAIVAAHPNDARFLSAWLARAGK